jgi:hypothetical protein
MGNCRVWPIRDAWDLAGWGWGRGVYRVRTVASSVAALNWSESSKV